MKLLRYSTLVLFLSAPLIAAPYKSTQDAIQDIKDTYETILKSDNIYKMPRLLDSLRNLSNRLNTHIMGKQGIVLGKKAEGIKLKQKIEVDNIFNIWDDMVYPAANNLINAIQTLRLNPSDQKARDLLETWREMNNWQGMIPYVKKIQADTILDSKKKIGNIIIEFIEWNIKLINKAWNDLTK